MGVSGEDVDDDDVVRVQGEGRGVAACDECVGVANLAHCAVEVEKFLGDVEHLRMELDTVAGKAQLLEE